MDRVFFLLGTAFGALGVGLGAFGAHALKERLSADMLSAFETGVRYQMYHSLALVAVVVALGRWPDSSLAVTAGWLFVAGIVLFSGSLYGLAVLDVRILGVITPLGGVAFIAGWLCLLLAAWRSQT